VFFGNERQRMQNALRALPLLHATTPIGIDVVTIGRVSPLGPEIDAPLSQRPCVAHCSLVYPKGVFGVVPPRGKVACVPFQIEREDGSFVVIESAHVIFVFPPLPLPDDAHDRCIELAIATGVPKRFHEKATYEEILVIETMRIAVAGRLVGNWAEGKPARIAGTAAQPIIIGVPF
jgi:hypothetical protein